MLNPTSKILNRECVECSTNINHKKQGSKYCSKRCNNKVNGRRRTDRARAERAKQDKLILEILESHHYRQSLTLAITYHHEGNRYTDLVAWTELSPPKDWTKRVRKVEIYELGNNQDADKPRGVLTQARAKYLLREASKL